MQKQIRSEKAAVAKHFISFMTVSSSHMQRFSFPQASTLKADKVPSSQWENVAGRETEDSESAG